MEFIIWCIVSIIMSTERNDSQVLSPMEQRVYLIAARSRIITLDDIRDVAPRYATARTVMSRLAKKGYLLRIRPGLYAAIPPESIGREYRPDRFLIADHAMGSMGAIAFHSALELHGVAHSYFNTVYYLSERSARPFEHQATIYRFVREANLFGTVTISREGVPLRVTDRERTFLDCIRRPEYCGGLEELVKSVGGFSLLNPLRLQDHLRRFGEQSLNQRTGVMLGLVRERLRMPDEFLERLRLSVGGNVYYLLPGMKPGNGRLDKEWNVIVPRNIDEVMRSV